MTSTGGTNAPVLGTNETHTASNVSLGLVNGDVLNVMFVDDNGVTNSPDDNFGIRSFKILPVPEPASLSIEGWNERDLRGSSSLEIGPRKNN